MIEPFQGEQIVDFGADLPHLFDPNFITDSTLGHMLKLNWAVTRGSISVSGHFRGTIVTQHRVV